MEPSIQFKQFISWKQICRIFVLKDWSRARNAEALVKLNLLQTDAELEKHLSDTVLVYGILAFNPFLEAFNFSVWV